MKKNYVVEVTGAVHFPSLGMRPIFQAWCGDNLGEAFKAIARTLIPCLAKNTLPDGSPSKSIGTITIRMGLLTDSDSLLRRPGTRLLRSLDGEVQPTDNTEPIEIVE